MKSALAAAIALPMFLAPAEAATTTPARYVIDLERGGYVPAPAIQLETRALTDPATRTWRLARAMPPSVLDAPPVSVLSTATR